MRYTTRPLYSHENLENIMSSSLQRSRGYYPQSKSRIYDPRFDSFQSEPLDLRRLRQQAERIREDKRREDQKLRNDYERERLREEIREAGHKPCC